MQRKVDLMIDENSAFESSRDQVLNTKHSQLQNLLDVHSKSGTQ